MSVSKATTYLPPIERSRSSMPAIGLSLSARQTIRARTHDLSLRLHFVSHCPSLFANFTFAKPTPSLRPQPHFTGPRQAPLLQKLGPQHLTKSRSSATLKKSPRLRLAISQNTPTRLHQVDHLNSTTPAQIQHLRATSAHNIHQREPWRPPSLAKSARCSAPRQI